MIGETNHYRLEHRNDDFKVSVEFTADCIEDVMMYIRAFLLGCTYSENTVNEYIPVE